MHAGAGTGLQLLLLDHAAQQYEHQWAQQMGTAEAVNPTANDLQLTGEGEASE
jgi:hypothetical protein